MESEQIAKLLIQLSVFGIVVALWMAGVVVWMLRRSQRRLFALDSLGEGGWLKALRLEGYAPRAPRRPQAVQQALFPYAEAL